VPGRGFADDRGVDAWTGMSAAGVPWIVTDTVALEICGLGVNETDGDGVVAGVVALLQAGMASPSEIAAKRIMTRLGMAGSVRRGRPPLRLARGKGYAATAAWLRK